jgi:hypothetical protein
MTVEDEISRAALRALMVFTQTAIPDYATDLVVQLRVGKVIADNAARVPIRPIGKRN